MAGFVRRREFVCAVSKSLSLRVRRQRVGFTPVRILLAIHCFGLSLLLQGCPSASESGAAPTATASDPESSGDNSDRPGALSVGLENPVTLSNVDHVDVEIGKPRLVDVYEELGFDFVLDNGVSPAMLMIQSTCGGATWLDYDADGWCDLYFIQGGYFYGSEEERRPSDDQLYRNMAGARFVNVSADSIPVDADFGQGAVAGDFDNDGFDDVYVSNVGPDQLYHNLGDGTFEKVSESAGIDNSPWSTSAAWYDLDQDGDLDIYVCNYCDYDPFNPVDCRNDEEEPGICHPRLLEAVPDACYFNQGDGTFLEESEARGLIAPKGKSLGVVVADFNGDRLPDVFVANDVEANHLFINLGDAIFQERAQALGCALSGLGHSQANMGVGFGDFDENEFPDLYITTFTADSNTLFANHGVAGFEDETRRRGLHQPTIEELGFGTVMSDFDFNGRQDIFIANGHIDDWREKGDMWYMSAQLFSFDGQNFHECSAEAGEYFERLTLARGVASADYDNDGDMDLSVVHQNEPSALLRNDSKRGHWLQLRFLGDESNRRGVGVHVTVSQGERSLVQQLAGGTSYCAGHQPALFFGLGESAEPCQVSVEWPSGRVQQLDDVKVDQILVLDESNAKEH